jgi:uncharacterized protein YjdB
MQRLERRCSVALTALVLLGACTETEAPLAGPAAALFIETPPHVVLEVGESLTITPPIRQSNNRPVNPRSLTWESSAEHVASVGVDGVVRGKSVGHAVVVASRNTVSDTTHVSVVSNGRYLTVTPDSVLLGWIGASARLEVLTDGMLTMSDAAPDGADVQWSSLSPEVVQVDSIGKINARALGVALIVAATADGTHADSARVRVAQVPATVDVQPASLSLAPGQSAELAATVRDSGNVTMLGASVSWTSSDPAVLTVSSTGQVTAVAAGSATVLAASGDASATSSVTVSGSTVSPPPASGSSIAELPRVRVNTDWVEPTGQVIFVPAGGDLQAAINSAKRGDVIELQAGATYTGNFSLPAKSGSGWVVIRTRGTLPAPGTRIRPAQAGNLAKLVSTNGASARVLTAVSGASHYRIVGLEITYAPTVTSANAIVDMRNGSRHIILDRSYVHGHSGLNLQRCVLMHAEHAAVIDSWLSQCHYKGSDSQAIVAWNTNGPLKIENNHLEGAGENVMFGGSTPAANTIPADIEIRRNHFYKPASWQLPDGTSRWTVKNLFEIKFAERVLLEGNVFDGNWRDGQDGHAFNIKLSARGSGDRVQDITIRYNILRRTRYGLKIVSPATRVVVEHNLLLVDSGRLFTLLAGTRDVHLLYNTGRHTGNIITSTEGNYGHRRFIARGNIWGGWKDDNSPGGYGVKGGGAEGTSTLNADFRDWIYENNGHIGRVASRYPAGNHFVSTEDAAMFDPAWRPRAGSPFAGLGADMDGVLSMTAGVVQN